jgi:hypothetical protein
MMKRRIMTGLLLVVVSVAGADVSPGTVGYQFLKTHVGARPAGMAGSFVAIDNDVNDIYYNPAGCAFAQKSAASFTYLNHLLDFQSGFVGYVRPIASLGTFSAGAVFMDYGDFDGRDISGEETGTFGASSFALIGGYAFSPLPDGAVGVNAKYIRASIDNYASDAVAVDASVMYKVPRLELSVAAGVYNLGTALNGFVDRKDDLPLTFRAGVAKRLAHLPLLLSFTVYKIQREFWHGAIGGEFTLSEAVQFRLGYDHAGQEIHVDGSSDRLAGASAGFGIHLSRLSIDYALTSLGELGTLNRFTVSSHF